ncbi:MAG: hypothetical protein R6U96_11980 [Promethearchaeia archaeon]
MINKENLKKSINLMSDIDFDDYEFENLYKKFEDLLGENQIKEIFEQIELDPSFNSSSLSEILKYLEKNMDIEELERLKKLIIDNENLVNFIQDLFLDKLI